MRGYLLDTNIPSEMRRSRSEPFDRQIIAQALAESIPVVTSDEKSSFIKGLEIIW